MLATIASLACLSGYAAASGTTAPLENSARVIVRFKPAAGDPDPAFLAALARSARVTRIEAMRRMSGDAFVLQVACDDPARHLAQHAAGACPAAIERLRRSEPVLMIDVDRREKFR